MAITKEMTLTEAKEAFLYLKNQKYSELRRLQKEEESYYLQTFNPFPNESPQKPYITHKVKPPRGRRIVDGPADWLAMDKVVIHIPPKGKPSGEETQKSRDAANQNEKWGQALLEHLAMLQPYYLRRLAQQLPLRGEAWLKIDVDWQYVQDPDGYEGVPIRWLVPDSMLVYAPMDMDAYSRPKLVFEEKTHTFGHLKELIAEWNKGRKPQKMPPAWKDIKDWQDIFLVEWTTAELRGYFAGQGGITEANWYAVRIDGEEKVPNLAGIVPYIRGFSSLGIGAYDGDLTKEIVSFLRPMGDVIIQDSRDRSKVDTITNYWAAPITSWITSSDEILGDAELTIAPGQVYQQIRDGTNFRKELKIEPAPPIPSSLIQQISMNESLLEEYDPMVLRGKASPGETAVGQNQRVGLGLSKWEPLKITLKQIMANAMSATFKIVEEMGVPVKVNEYSLDKKDINDYYKNEIDIKPGNPEEQTRRLLLVKDMTDFLTEEEEAAMMGIENSTEHFRQLRLKKMINLMAQNPRSPYFQMVWMQAVKELGMEELQAELDEVAALTGAPKENGQTPEGPVEGAHPGQTAGIATAPEAPAQKDMEAAQNAMGRVG